MFCNSFKLSYVLYFKIVFILINFFTNSLNLVSGLGFGVMSGLFSLINVLADSVGPGTVGLYGDSHFFFITSGNVNLDNKTK